MNVLIILGHPRKDSFCASLLSSFAKGANDAGCKVETIFLSDLKFNPNVTVHSPETQFLEKDILKSVELINWANHIVIVYPTWWGNLPGLLKSFLDRVVLPGEAFNELQFDTYEKKWQNKTAHLFTTMDIPLFVYKFIYGSPGTKALSIATLKFCGISPVKKTFFTPIKHSTFEQKEIWMKQMYESGNALQYGVLSDWNKCWRKISPWIKAVRLQFYPMSFFAYGLGAFCADFLGFEFSWLIFIIGYLYVFLLEIAVVFSNDFFDYESDKINRNFSLFSGGSRVLVEKLISKFQMKKAITLILIFDLILLLIIAILSPTNPYTLILITLFFSILSLSYTVPPIKFSHRGAGELMVGFTHSFIIIFTAFMFQGGTMSEPLPYLVSIPLFFSILPAIIMSGIPDYLADKTSGKKTLVVRLGENNSTLIAIFCVMMAVFSSIILYINQSSQKIYGWEVFPAALHGYLLCRMLIKFYKKKEKPSRIDAIMGVALLFLMWYVLIPFIRFL